jgi:glycosidase
VVIKGASMQKIVDVLQHDELYPHPETLVTFIGNHDDRRFVGEEGSSPAKLRAAFSLLLTLRGIPQIYSGDEIAMPGGDDPDNRRDFPEGFPGDLHNAFAASGRTPEQQDTFAYVQSLLALRKAHPALRTGKQWHIGWDNSYYAFLRELPEEKPLVVYNNSSSSRELTIPVVDTPLADARRLQPVFDGTPIGVAANIIAGELHITVPSQTLAVFNVQ